MRALSVTYEKLAAEAKLAQLPHPLLSEEKVKEIWQALDGRHRLEFLLDLWRASLMATEANDFRPLAKLLADWEATAEILADRDLVQAIREERSALEEEKGRSWEEREIEILKVVPHL
ncbi:MAG TPA: hypothetical protein EYP55_07040 [Anaerolineae bacterium]|nr:hypothetical protein [Anaerolineae bacterium]